MEILNKNNFYVGNVVEKRNISRDGVGSSLIVLYETIAYKKENGEYYDYLSKHNMSAVDYNNHEYGQFYFIEKESYFKNNTDLTVEEIEQLFSDIGKYSKEPAFTKPESTKIR